MRYWYSVLHGFRCVRTLVAIQLGTRSLALKGRLLRGVGKTPNRASEFSTDVGCVARSSLWRCRPINVLIQTEWKGTRWSVGSHGNMEISRQATNDWPARNAHPQRLIKNEPNAILPALVFVEETETNRSRCGFLPLLHPEEREDGVAS